MKRLYITFLALAIALVMIMPMAVPVVADSPTVVGYVTGSFITNINIGQTEPEDNPVAKFGGNVKLLSDGTIVGCWNNHMFKSAAVPEDWKGQWRCHDDDFISLTFSDDHTAVIRGYFYAPSDKDKEFPFDMTIVIEDNGEPGVGVDIIYPGTYPWVPFVVERGNFQVWVSDEYVP